MVANERNKPVQELNEEDTIRLLTHTCLSDVKVVEFNFQGGEPLIASNFLAAVEWLGEHSIPWSVNTNGTLWNTVHLSLIKKYPPREIVVSLDGDAETHNWLRGHGVFQKLQNTIMKIYDACGERTQVDAICVLHKRNVKNIMYVFEIAAQLKIRQLVLSKLSIAGNAIVNRDLLEPEAKDLFDVFKIVARLNGQYEDVKIFVPWATPLMLAYYDLPISYSGCPAIRSEVTISPTGELQPCPNALARLQRLFGEKFCSVKKNISLLDNDLESIRTSHFFKYIYELLHGPLNPPRHSRCQSCRFIELCETCPSDRWIGEDDNAKLCHQFQDFITPSKK